MWIFYVLGYFVIGAVLFLLFAQLEKTEIFEIFAIEDNEVLVSVLMELFWPLFMLVAIFAIPGKIAKHRFNKS